MGTTAHIALPREVALHGHMDVVADTVPNRTASGFKAEARMFEPMGRDAGREQRPR